MAGSSYRRVVVTRYGQPEVLRLEEAALVEPGPGEARVRVRATGVAFADVLMRHGVYPGTPKPPFAPGYDVAGVIDAVGPGVDELRPGDPVVGLTVRGGYAESLVAPAADLVRAPEGLDPAEATCVVLNYLTAWQCLHRKARVRAGERVLVHGAAGGVGTALLQLGRLAGLELLGTASRAKHEVVRANGATPIDYRSEDFAERIAALSPPGVDAVFDGVGGRNVWRSYRCLRRGGRLVGYGATTALSGRGASFAALAATVALVSLLGLLPDGRRAWFYRVEAEKRRAPKAYRKDLATLLDLLARGEIRPLVAERLPLEHAARAHEMLERSAFAGKVVLICERPGSPA